MDGLFLLFFALGSFDNDYHERTLPRPLAPLQSILEDAHIYKKHQNLCHEKIIENLTTSPGTFCPQAIDKKFGSKKNANEAICTLTELLNKESEDLEKKVSQIKTDEEFKGTLEEFKTYCTKKKNQALLKTMCSLGLGVFSLNYLLGNKHSCAHYLLKSTTLSGLLFGLWSGLEAKITEDNETQTKRLLALNFEKKVLSDLKESLNKN